MMPPVRIEFRYPGHGLTELCALLFHRARDAAAGVCVCVRGSAHSPSGDCMRAAMNLLENTPPCDNSGGCRKSPPLFRLVMHARVGGGLINVIEVGGGCGAKEKKKEQKERRKMVKHEMRAHVLEEVRTTPIFCDFACFHGVRIIAPFKWINENSGTRDICIGVALLSVLCSRGKKEKRKKYVHDFFPLFSSLFAKKIQ